jgi:two-component system, OmpR family, sensor histidine kinase KdpD
LLQRVLRLVMCFGAVGLVTFVAFRVIPVNATTVGFAYMLLVLIVASTWGFFEASLTSIAATLLFNLCFLEPIGKLTIADPKNWVALFTFLASSLIASRLSTKAKQHALDVIRRQQDVERLYSLSRAILLTSRDEPFAKQLVQKLADIFQLTAAVLYDRRARELYRAGPADFQGLDDQLRDAALSGTSFSGKGERLITAVRLGSEPIASLALQGTHMPDSVIQGIANLVAIGLERARAQELAHDAEAAQRSEQLRTVLIDAMAHEFKTPLTLIKGATTSVLAGPDHLSDSTREQLTIADEEADHLRDLLDNAIVMARLDTNNIDVHLELWNLEEIVRDVLASMHVEIEDRPLNVTADAQLPLIPLDRRLLKLAIKQLIDNAVKYSPPDSPIAICIHVSDGAASIDVTDHGGGIASEDQQRIFERFYRGHAVRNQIPGYGLGLNIASSIMHAHHGDLSVTSQPGETTFRITLPLNQTEGGKN